MNHERIFRYIGVTATALLLIGLAGWYLFLRFQSGAIESVDGERGFDISIPSFSSARGSTSINSQSDFFDNVPIVSNIINAVGRGENNTSSPPRLWKISPTPVAGAGFLSDGTLRYVERATGHVFDVNLQNGQIARRTNNLRPQIYEALVAPDGTVIERSIENDRRVTFLGTVSTTTDGGVGELRGRELPTDIIDIIFSPNSEVAYTIRSPGGETLLMRLDRSNATSRQIASLGVGAWNLNWIADDRFLITEDAATAIPGSAYELRGTSMEPVLLNVSGLVTLTMGTSTSLYYSSDAGSSPFLFHHSRSTHASTNISLNTTAEKCAWARETGRVFCASPRTTKAPYLDSWYQGLIHTADTWWSIDGTSRARELYTPPENQPVDVERPIVDDVGTHIVFMNAADKSLWALRVNEN